MRNSLLMLFLAGLLCGGLACSQRPPEESPAPEPATTVIVPPPAPQLPNVVPTNPYKKPAEQEVVQLPPRPPDTYLEEVLPIPWPGITSEEFDALFEEPEEPEDSAEDDRTGDKDGAMADDDGGWGDDTAATDDGGGWGDDTAVTDDGGGWGDDTAATDDGGGWGDDTAATDDDGGWGDDDGGGWGDDDGGGWGDDDGGGWGGDDGGGSGREADVPMSKFVYRAHYQPAGILRTLLEETYSNDSPTPTFIANANDREPNEWSDMNELIIVATRRQYAEIRSLLNKIDHAPLQVYFDMWIGEVNLQDNETLGTTLTTLFEGQVDAGDANLPFEGAMWTRFNNVITTAEGLTYAVGSQGNFAAIFNALASENRLRVLSDPHLFVRNNKTATIEVGERVPVKEVQVDNDIRIETIRTEDVHLTLSITPQINANGTILVQIEQVIDEIGERDYGGTGAPSVRTRSASTELLLHDGLTVLMGGLISLRDERITTGIPLLKDIPLLGRLFRSTTNAIKDQELVLLITPHIMWTSEHQTVYTGVMNDYMRKWKDQEYFIKPDNQRVRELLNIMPPDEEKGQ